MRKYIFPILLVMFLLFAGCSLPAATEEEDAVATPASDENSGGELSVTPKGETVSGLLEDNTAADQAKLLITLYYQDKENTVIPVTRKVAKQEGIAKAALKGLIDSAVTREELEYYGLYPVLPEGTEIRGMTIKDGTAFVDFSDKLLDYNSEADERSIISSIVYTLTDFKTIDGVNIRINGQAKDTLKFGTDVSGVLNRRNTMINADSSHGTNGREKLDLYMLKHTKDDFLFLLPVSVETEAVDEDKALEIVKLLGGQYRNEFFTSAVPQEIGLISSSMDGSLLTLNFNKHFHDYGGTSQEDAMLKQILYSMGQLEGVEKVKILVEGEIADMPEGTDISREIAIPAVVNDCIDK